MTGRATISALLLALSALGGGCTSVVRYTNELVSDEHGRTYFTRAPSALGGTVGFAVGLPVDVAALPATFVFYRSQPKETRDVLSVFLFPSFVLWQSGLLLGVPFDAVEWAAWRSWQAPRPLTPAEREAAERAWDAEEFSAYPVTPIYPR
ncbi:MAG: hypothetical protein ACON4Z_16660 [Planctomycetota bacterium]